MLLALVLWHIFLLPTKQLSEQWSHTELKTFGAAQGPNSGILVPRATSHIFIFKQLKTGDGQWADYSPGSRSPESADLSCVLGLGPSPGDLSFPLCKGLVGIGGFTILSHSA